MKKNIIVTNGNAHLEKMKNVKMNVVATGLGIGTLLVIMKIFTNKNNKKNKKGGLTKPLTYVKI